MTTHTFDVDGFLFDMDGTLVDSHAVVEQAWASFGARHDIPVDDILAFSHGRQTRATVERFLAHESEEVREAEITRMNTTESESPDGVVEIPGATALLTRLRELDAPVALVTSADLKLATNRMQAAGVPLPDVLVTEEDSPRSKPHPGPFLTGAERLGLDIFACVAFEDSPAGIEAVRASGADLVIVGESEASQPSNVRDLRAVSVERLGHVYRVTITH